MDLFKTFNVQLYVIESSALKHLHLHIGYALPPFIEQHCDKIITMDTLFAFLTCVLLSNLLIINVKYTLTSY
ncbi:hypothetical protein T01_14037 [Trichinella spiralis]|uniref:Uncharacterized protein n=1 Tax=Trichinella spiralis TaxID=6334 RepID=A0A0V1B8Q7_TRISP|nr:hypothetical protein T01_14037 [Trichinella spiralis]